jgi:hypothetical protein
VIAFLIPLFAILPVRTAETVPAGTTALHLDAGFLLVHLGYPVAPIAPILTGGVELATGLGDGVDLRARYETHLGALHRVGPELRVRALATDAFVLGARLHPSAQIGGAWQDGADVAGDVSTETALLGTHRRGAWAFTLEAGVTIQWLVFEQVDGASDADTRPYLAFYDLAMEVEVGVRRGATLGARLEVAIPTAPDDPFATFGVVPRLVAGGSFGL